MLVASKRPRFIFAYEVFAVEVPGLERCSSHAAKAGALTRHSRPSFVEGNIPSRNRRRVCSGV